MSIVWPSWSPTFLTDNLQTSSSVVEKVGNRIQIITSGGECAKDGKVKKNYEDEDRDNIDGIAEEGCGIAPTQRYCSGFALRAEFNFWQVLDYQSILYYFSGKNREGKTKEDK